MELSAGRSGSVPIEAFLAKYSARKVRPVYPAMVRTKKAATSYGSPNRHDHPPEVRKAWKSFSRPISAPLKFLAPTSLSSTLPPNTLANSYRGLRTDTDVEFAEAGSRGFGQFHAERSIFFEFWEWGQSYSDLWGIKEIGAPSAWDTTAGAGMIVAGR